MIEREPHDTIPSHERFQLAAIGIEKGKPFTPDAARKALFDDAARFASAIARTNSFDSDDPARLVYPDRALGVGVHRRVCQLGLAGLRQHRPPLQLRLHRDRHVAGDGREACRHRLAVSVDAARRERRLPRRRQALSSAHSAEHPGEEFLVGRRLRRRQPLDPAQRPAVSVGEHVHRARPRMPMAPSTSTSAPKRPPVRRSSEELDPDDARQGLVHALPLLRSARAVLRQTWKPDDIVEIKQRRRISREEQIGHSLNNIAAKKESGQVGHHSVRRLRRQMRPTACRSCRAGTDAVRLYRPRKEILDGTWMFPGSAVP